MKNKIVATLAGMTLGIFAVQPASATTLDEVKAKGFIQCGVNEGLPGFSIGDSDGNWSGLDVDYCRGVAAAIFNDPQAVKFTPLSATQRFDALTNGDIDILSRNTTWTMGRDTDLGVAFAGIDYFDGQGFMVRKSLGVSSALELSGASVCTNKGTTTELNLADFFDANRMELEIVSLEKNEEVVAAYDAGRCDAYTTDASGLYAQRLKLTNPDDHIVLPEIISKEPLGPVVRDGDEQWTDIARWVLFAMINAEELGVTQANVAEMKKSTNPEIRRLLGTDGDFGKGLGLSKDWAANIVSSVGNYGEIFERNVGPNTPLGIARGLNALWSKGGLMYAPPIR